MVELWNEKWYNQKNTKKKVNSSRGDGYDSGRNETAEERAGLY